MLVLEVTARNGRGSLLALISGPLLAASNTRESPSGGKAFARATSSSHPRDTRLAPFATDVSRYRFSAPDAGSVEVAARLLLAETEGEPIEIARTFITCRDRVPADRSR
jgi:hypothetical protein